MDILSARSVYNYTKAEIWNLPDSKMILEFDDGVLETNNRATLFSWYLGAYHRLYPETPLLREHHLGDAIIGKDTHLDILGKCLFDTLDTYRGRVDIEVLTKIAYEVTNDIYNDFTTKLKSYVSSINILDFIDAVEHPRIKKANDEVRPEQYSIDQVYKTIRETLGDFNDTSLKKNTLSRMAKSGLVSMGQIQQCIGPRGYLTDIDSNIFKDPILKSFTHGLIDLPDAMKDSRTATKALKFADEKIADTEYFNREMQLLTHVITRVHEGDCGSKEYINFTVRANDLRNITGKFYLADNDKLLEVIDSDKHLVGKTIKMRSSVKCIHPDAYGVCATCMGRLADSIPRGTNVGHVAATELGEMITQILLSTKHLESSSKVDEFQLTEYDKKYIFADNDSRTKENEGTSNTVILLAERLSGRKVTLTLAEEDAKGLSEIDYHSPDKLIPSMLSKLKDVSLTIEDKTGFSETVTVPVSMGNRLSWLTLDALKYIKSKGWSLSDRGNYVVDLSEWDVSLPLFQLPLRHTDMGQYMKAIKSFLISTGREVKGEISSVDNTLINFHNLISAKLNVNIAHSELMIAATLVKDAATGDHRLPTPKSTGKSSPYRENMKMRSLGPMMAYQGQGKVLTSVQSFIYKQRPDSIFDNLLVPLPIANPTD